MSTRSTSNLRARSKQCGASYTELIIILPLMMLFLFGLAWAGRMFSQMIPFSKIAYETTRVGGDATSLYGLSAMQYRFEQLYSNTYNANSDLSMNAAGIEASTSYSSGQVIFKSLGEAKGLSESYLPTQFKMNYVASVLESHANTAGLTGTDNADCGYYDCNGHCNAYPLTEACPVTPPADEQGQSSGGGGGYHCFAAGTPIRMADGSAKGIESIQIGDLVRAVDLNSGHVVAAPVIDTMSAVSLNYFLLNGSIEVTAEHPFFVEGKWIKAKDIKLNDLLMGEQGEQVRVVSKVIFSEQIQVFNLTVDRVHNYFAGGVLVHNKSTPGGGGIAQVGDKTLSTQ